MTNSIILICPYIGRWPGWFPYFVQSCKFNPTINWVFFSNCEPPENVPDNMVFRKTTLAEYNAMASDRLAISFKHTRPYKLCDLKPAYGYIHEDIIKDYDFWGFCDIDLVFGNIREFLTPSVLSHDVISTHQKRISGHFSIFRNTEQLRTAFMKAKRWKTILEDDNNHRFDERHFSNLFVKFKHSPAFVQKLWESTMPLAANIYFKEQYSTMSTKIRWEDGTLDFPSTWYWKNGKLSNNRGSREYMYFHFLRWKTYWDSSTDWSSAERNSLEDEWAITETGFSAVKAADLASV